MPIVRIHLNLNHPERAENSVRLVCADGTCPTVAYATHLILKNVRTIIDEAKRDGIAHGDSKTPCAYLEGELESWTGRLREKASAKVKATIEPYRTDRQGIERQFLPDAERINFNPKKAKRFYNENTPASFFETAERAVITHWDFAVENPVWRPAEPGEILTDRPRASQVELCAIRRGKDLTNLETDRLRGRFILR